MSSGLLWYGDTERDQKDVMASAINWVGEFAPPKPRLPNSMSKGARWACVTVLFNAPIFTMPSQKLAKDARADSRTSPSGLSCAWAKPWAIATAFIAPALVPLMPSNPTRPSSNSASRTPQVNAP